jgi:hypothetical protein
MAMTDTAARRPVGRRTTQRPDEKATEAPAEERGDERRGAARHSVPIPHLTLPGLAVWHIPLPRVSRGGHVGVAGDLLVLGGLLAVTALGVIEWPVAAVVGAGVLVAERRAAAVAISRASRDHKE